MKKYELFLIILLFGKCIYSQGIGFVGGGDLPPEFFIHKGEARGLWGLEIINYTDRNGDGVTSFISKMYDVVNYEQGEEILKSCFSLKPNFYTGLVELYPNQNKESYSKLYINCRELKVGESYQIFCGACNEPPTPSGGIGTRVCAGKIRPIYIVPYTIPIESVQNSTGSYSSFYLSWIDPSPLYWNLDSYLIFRRDDDSVRLGELQLCDIIRTNIPSNIHSVTINDNKRGINSFYAIVGYDSLGEAIAISESFQAAYPKNNFGLLTPTDGQILTTQTPTLDWEDYEGATSYTLWYSEDSTFSTKVEVTGITSSNYTLTSSLGDHKTYYWKVKTDSEILSDETGWNFGVNTVNVAPSAFSLLSPMNNQSVNSLQPSLIWEESIDVGDKITYTIQIAEDVLFTNIVKEKTTWVPYFNCADSLEDNMDYYWRVKVIDSQGEVVWSTNTFMFSVHYDDYPSEFELVTPTWNVEEIPVETNLYPEFKWRRSSDGDGIDNIRYTLWYSDDSTFQSKKEVTNLTDTNYTPITPLTEDRYYYWRVYAMDDSGNVRTSSGLPYAFVTNSNNRDPDNPILDQPVAQDSVARENILISWSKVTDDLYDYIFYDLIVSSNIQFSDTVYSQMNILFSDYHVIPYLNYGKYYIKIYAHSLTNNFTYGGESEAYVDSFFAYCKINSIVSPVGGEEWPIGANKDISWTSVNIANVKISYSTNGGTEWLPIIDNGDGFSQHSNWLIPNTPTDSALVRISDVRDTIFFVISDSTFRIRNSSITLLKPSGDIEYKTGDDCEITWNSSYVNTVSLQYSLDNGTNWTTIIDSVTSSEDSYLWNIPNQGSESVKIKIFDKYFPEIFDKSASAFSIRQLFTHKTTIPQPSGGYTVEAAMCDYDKDNDFDIAFMNKDNTYIYNFNDSEFVYLNVSLKGYGYGQIEWSDNNNDGLLDIFISGRDYFDGYVKSAIFNYNGTQFDNTQLGFGSTAYNGAFDLGDYDNDGDYDVISSGSGGMNMFANPQTHLNNNNKINFNEVTTNIPNLLGSSVKWIDYDNDLDLDIIISGDSLGYPFTALYQNNNGEFIKVPSSIRNTSFSSIAIGDYNSDGWMDVLIGGSFLDGTKLYKNINGVFEEQNFNFRTIGDVHHNKLKFGDYDNDGDLDILIGEWWAPALIYKNENGGFKLINCSLSSMSNSISFCDYDGDNDLDIILAQYSIEVFENNINKQNTPPSAPANLYSTTNDTSAILSWDKSLDNETPTDGLTYNLRIGTTPFGCEITSPLSDPVSGSRLVPKMGNVQLNNSWIIKNLPHGKYFWSVQAIDNSFAGSQFATEKSFIVGGVKIIPEGLYNNITNNLSMCDTVSIYLRHTIYPFLAIDSSVSIIDSTTFTTLPKFLNAPSGNYYLVVKHHNSIETWSKEALLFTEGGSISYDFNDAQYKAYGSNLKLKGSKWCMYGGEIANGDEYIDGDDVTAAFNAQGLSGYVIQDVTGDDYVDGDDVTLVFNNQGIGVIRP